MTAPLELRGEEPVEAPSAAFRELARRLGKSRTLQILARRLVTGIPVLWGVSFFTFVVMNLLPGDAAQEILGLNATPAQVKAYEIQLHLNLPFWTRYWDWFVAALHGNLGTSLQSNTPVNTIIAQRLPVSFELVLYTFVVSLVFSIPFAVLAARRPDGLVDRFSQFVSMLSLSVAPYVLALIVVLVFAVKLHWFPAIGWVPINASVGGNLQSLTLPALSLGLVLTGFYMRLLRADLLAQMREEEYTTVARAKGLSWARTVTRHALRNSLFPLITIVGINFARLLEGTILVETIFGLPGIGQELINAINVRDVPVVEGVVAVMAVIVVIANIITDLLYGVLDPRIRYGRSET